VLILGQVSNSGERRATGRSGPSLRGVATMTASALSNQVGAALGAHAFGAVGVPGVVAVRQVVAALVLLPVARPPLRRMTRSQWWPVLLLAGVFGCMNLSLYSAIDRIGLGLAVPGLQAPAVASLLCALAVLPVLGVLAAQGRLTGAPLGYAVLAGVLASVVPYAADLTALRYVPPRAFGVFMSIHPVLAALVGIVLLDQPLVLHEWTGIAVVVTANVVAVGTSGRRSDDVDEGQPAGPRPVDDEGAVPAVPGPHGGHEVGPAEAVPVHGAR